MRDEVRKYLTRILNKEAFDKRGLIYGMGHAVYSISDPREKVFKEFVEKLADEKQVMMILNYIRCCENGSGSNSKRTSYL